MKNILSHLTSFLAKAKRIPVVFGSNIFITFLGLLALAITLSLLAFYQYVFLLERQEIAPDRVPGLEFQTQTLQDLREEWNTRDDNFEGADPREYREIFDVFSGG